MQLDENYIRQGGEKNVANGSKKTLRAEEVLGVPII